MVFMQIINKGQSVLVFYKQMDQKQGKKVAYLDPTEISNKLRLSHIQLDVCLRNLKERIDREFEQFRVTLVSALNHLNFIRYAQTYPSDDFTFIFKEKVNVSKVESRLEQKEEILRRMSEFSAINLDVGGISDNCTWQLDHIITAQQPILDVGKLCPTGNTFLQRNNAVLKQYLQFWKTSSTPQLSMGNIFKEMSPVFSKEEIKKVGAMFSQINKRLSSARLLFRASAYNFQSALFKEHCVGKGHTLMIAKSDKGKVFGGYTPAKWLNTKEKQYVSDPTATSFLFSLTDGLVFPIKKNQLDYAISAYGGWGPIYGSPYGPDLSISDKCHMNENSCSSLGSHYDIPVNVKEYSEQAFSLLAGSKKFKVVQYQVYEVFLE